MIPKDKKFLNNLPCAAINCINVTPMDESLRIASRKLVNQLIRRTRTLCNLQFLRTCLKAQVIPLFIAAWFINVPVFKSNDNSPALARKLHSTKLELLRCSINEQEKKLGTLERMSGYDYLHVTRRGQENWVRTFLEKLNAAVREEE